MTTYRVITYCTITQERYITADSDEELFTVMHDADAEGTWGDHPLGDVLDALEYSLKWEVVQ